MSGVASPPPTASAPSAARADDLFALVKFIQSDDAQTRLKELQEIELRATEQRALADASIEVANKVQAKVAANVEQHNAAVESFKAQSSAHQERLNQREATLQSREAAVLQREDRCTTREREHQATVAAAESEATQREARLAQRERELDARIQAHDAERAAFERRQAAVDQAYRS